MWLLRSRGAGKDRVALRLAETSRRILSLLSSAVAFQAGNWGLSLDPFRELLKGSRGGTQQVILLLVVVPPMPRAAEAYQGGGPLDAEGPLF